MSLSDLASIATLVSSFAVLVSLIYLALQTRQSARNQRATIQWGRLQERNAGIRNITQADCIDTYIRGSAGDTTLDDAQCVRYFTLAANELREYEELFHQYRDA